MSDFFGLALSEPNLHMIKDQHDKDQDKDQEEEWH